MSIKWVNPGARAVRILERDKANQGPEQWLTVEPIQPVPDFMGALQYRLRELFDTEEEALDGWYRGLRLRLGQKLTGTLTDFRGRRLSVSGQVSVVRLADDDLPTLVSLSGAPRAFLPGDTDRLFLTDEEAIAFLAREKDYTIRSQRP